MLRLNTPPWSCFIVLDIILICKGRSRVSKKYNLYGSLEATNQVLGCQKGIPRLYRVATLNPDSLGTNFRENLD